MRTLALAALLGLAVAPRAALAIAHHEQVVVQKLRDASNQVIGARVHLVIDPESYNRVRINVGKLTVDPRIKTNNADHRRVAAGVKPGYVRLQLGELQNLKLRGSGPSSYRELQEVKFDVLYGRGNDLKAGEKVDIYTTFTTSLPKDDANSSWHVFGMHDGPVTQGDTTHVHELPSEGSSHGEATEQAP
jgi:hypothetical protein